MSTDWNEKAKILAKTLKAQKNVKWDELANKINQLNPDDEPITAGNLSSSVTRGNYNVRLLLKMADALGLEVTFTNTSND